MILKFKIFEKYENKSILNEINNIITKDILPYLSKNTEHKFENNIISVNDSINSFKFEIYISNSGDKLVLSIKVKNDPAYEFDFPIDNEDNINRIINFLNKELDNIDEKSEDKENIEKIKLPTIKTIKSILEEAYILDELELHDITINDLIRRMLKENKK
jgi:CHAT domain-containing protein